MGFMSILTGFLSLSQKSVPQPAFPQTFTLEVWLKSSPLNHQAVSWYPISNDAGYFGIEIRSPSEPLPSQDHAIFVRDSSYPEGLFFQPSKAVSGPENAKKHAVLVQPTGEIQYALEGPGAGDPKEERPFTGNFSIVDFTYWPDKKTYYSLEFEPPGFLLGVFLACPGTVAGKRGYLLYAMTHIFKRGGCITLDWLVTNDVVGDLMEETYLSMEGHAGL